MFCQSVQQKSNEVKIGKSRKTCDFYKEKIGIPV